MQPPSMQEQYPIQPPDQPTQQPFQKGAAAPPAPPQQPEVEQHPRAEPEPEAPSQTPFRVPPGPPKGPPPPLPPWTQLANGSPAQEQNRRTPSQASASEGGDGPSISLIEAVRTENLESICSLLSQRANINYTDPRRLQMTPLHHALEAGGSISTVNLLLKARADPNARTATGQMPLLMAVQRFMGVPPTTIRMLVCCGAEVERPDSSGMTALDSIRQASALPANRQGEPSMRLRQVLNEIMDKPTLDVCVIDGHREVTGALFADLQNDKVVIIADSSICLYSLAQKRTIFMNVVKQQRASSTVKHISVNPELGTLAACLELVETLPSGQTKMQNLFIIWPVAWPTCQQSGVEPLKLSIDVQMPANGATGPPACAILSRTRGPQFLVGRLVGGKVYGWRLRSCRTQLASEVELAAENAGAVAVSDDGFWVAIAVDSEAERRLNIFSYASAEGPLLEPRRILSEDRAPACLAVQQAPGSSVTAAIAMADKSVPGMPLPPIEILAVSVDGISKVTYRLQIPSPCLSLDFARGVVTHMVSRHHDGLIVLYDLPSGMTSQVHASPNTRSLDISPDRSMAVATESTSFRIFKMPQLRQVQ